MRKYLLALLTLVMCSMVGTECFASKAIDEDHAAIGGITLGSRTEYVESIYGAPNKILETEDGRAVEWYYGDTFQMRFVDDRAVFVCSSGNNGLNTPDDVGVGMKSRLIKKIFGRPNEKFKFDLRQVYVYDIKGAGRMMFVLNDGWITEIRLTATEE